MALIKSAANHAKTDHGRIDLSRHTALKNPLDFWIYQEILWECRPDVIVEIGNFRGGSTLALAHTCDLLAKGTILAVDTTHDQIASAVHAHPRIQLITGDACEVLTRVKSAIPGTASVMVMDDSVHTYDHTLKVLEHYADVVTVGNYFIVEDGICHHGLDVGQTRAVRSGRTLHANE